MAHHPSSWLTCSFQPTMIFLAAYFISFSCTVAEPQESPHPLFPAASVTTEDISEAIRFEWELRKVYDVDPKPNEPWFALEEGASSVLVTAPHATAQMREGKSKWADAGTGALAHMLHRLANTTILHAARRSPKDPNFYDDCEFKTALGDYLTKRKPVLVLDLHTSSAKRPYDVDFGTMHGASLLGKVDWLTQLVNCFRADDFNDFSQDYFAAEKAQTDTKFVNAHGIPCVQLEISEVKLNLFNEAEINRMTADEVRHEVEKSGGVENSPIIVNTNGAHQFSQTLEAMVRFIKSVEK